MAIELEKLQIGIFEFTSVFLPGGLLTYFLHKSHLIPAEWVPVHPANSEWIAFGVAAYILGHAVYLFGSLLDGVIDAMLEGWLKIVREWRPVPEDEPMRTLVLGLLKPLSVYELEPLFKGVRRTAEFGTSAASRVSKDYFNGYQWSKCWLALHQAEAFQQVLKIEADSKFFRSLAIVILVVTACLIPKALLPALIVRELLCGTGVTRMLLTLSFWRYRERRVTGIRQALWFVLAATNKS